MTNVTACADPVLDIWSYVRSIPSSDYHPYEIWDEYVECVYRTPDNKIDLIHVCTKTNNVFVVIVIERPSVAVLGHHLLNLNKLYAVE
jgi:hypothetical protein